MPKFFVKNNQVNEDRIKIIGKDVNHIKNVLRKTIGMTIEICNSDTSINYLAEINKIDEKSIECKIIENVDLNTESNVQITIYQGLPKADKMELVIQKSVELGAFNIVPVSMKRCVVKLSSKDEDKKIQRWQKISEVASKQSGRNIIPKICKISTVEDICNSINNYDLVIVAYENEKNNTLKNELEKLNDSTNKKLKIAIVIGPEGGIELKEVEQLKRCGAKIVTLGNRILRTETVALSIISIINYVFED